MIRISLYLLIVRLDYFQTHLYHLEYFWCNASTSLGNSVSNYSSLHNIIFQVDVAPKEKSRGVESDERAGHFNRPRLSIHMPDLALTGPENIRGSILSENNCIFELILKVSQNFLNPWMNEVLKNFQIQIIRHSALPASTNVKLWLSVKKY